MKKLNNLVYLIFVLLIFSFFANRALAEDLPSGRVIPKLPVTSEDPKLIEGHVYPFWGPVCQRYTYSVIYQDEKNRPPEYVKIYFNGEMKDMEKENSSDSDYKKGVKYIFQNVPNKFGSNFYYFEASNGIGKTRDSIIDSPDNGPVLFNSDFKNNEIVLIDSTSGQKVWQFPTGEEWVGAVALSDEGKYLVAQTSYHVYFFNTIKKEPIWSYESKTDMIGGDVKGGVAISGDGSKIFAALNGKALYFDNGSNKPIWEYNLEPHGSGAYGVDISKDGKYAAVAMAGEESNENSNVLILLNDKGEKLWQYHASGNWHEVSLSDDGSYLAGATGCPDRRGYIFSKDSNKPIVRTDPLSVESPIDEAQISADGQIAAFGIESGYGGIALLNRNSNQPVWKFDTPGKKSVRSLSITPDGKYLGAGTFGGDIFIFSSQSPSPESSWKLNTAIGALDISGDASMVAAGGTDKKVHLFQKGQQEQKAEILLNEYVGEIDISSNGQYIVAGTGGSVYFFETISDLDETKVFPCDTVIEPKPESEINASMFNQNADQNSITSKITLPIKLLGCGFVATLLAFIIYLLTAKKKRVVNKKIVYIFVVLLIFLVLAIAVTTIFFN